MNKMISDSVRELLVIVARLRARFPKKRFTLDGRLVGDIGEALAECMYDVTIFDGLQKHHDAKTNDGRLVQIKATMQKSLTFPAGHIPDLYLGLHISEDGVATEVFNGPGELAWQAVRNRQTPKNNLHSISLAALRELNKSVRDADRIKTRSSQAAHAPSGPAPGAAAPAHGV